MRAWRLGIREGITRPEEAVRLVRLAQRLEALPEADRIAYALGELSAEDPDEDPDEVHRLRVWLADHGVSAGSDAIRAAVQQRAHARQQQAARLARFLGEKASLSLRDGRDVQIARDRRRCARR